MDRHIAVSKAVALQNHPRPIVYTSLPDVKAAKLFMKTGIEKGRLPAVVYCMSPAELVYEGSVEKDEKARLARNLRREMHRRYTTKRGDSGRQREGNERERERVREKERRQREIKRRQ